MSGTGFLEPADWYAQLPTFYAAAGALLTDPTGQVLLVKPNYRDHWNVPGGTLDHGEAPHECCVREVAEELGIKINVGRLLVVDWSPPLGKRPQPMAYFLFDGGTLDNPDHIRLQADELDDWQLIHPDHAHTLLPPHIAPRIPAALAARADNTTTYLPHR